MFRVFATDEEFAFRGIFYSYDEAAAAVADAEAEFDGVAFEVQELVTLSEDSSEWQAATAPGE